MYQFIYLLLFYRNLRQNQIEWIPARAFTSGRRVGTKKTNQKDGDKHVQYHDDDTDAKMTEVANQLEIVSSSLVWFDVSANPLVQVHTRAFINMQKLRKL